MSNILVIDDNEATCHLMRMICSHAGFEVTTALNAQDGIALAQQVQPVIIFVDLQLPGNMNGWEAISFFKHDADLRSKPVIAISAGSHKQTAAEAGSDGYLQKPFTAQQVMEFIERYS